MSRLVVGENNLFIWCLNNGGYGQQLIEEWLGLDEFNNPIKIDEVTRGSVRRVKWKCRDGHE